MQIQPMRLNLQGNILTYLMANDGGSTLETDVEMAYMNSEKTKPLPNLKQLQTFFCSLVFIKDNRSTAKGQSVQIENTSFKR